MSNVSDFPTTLLHWYGEHGRELPWRGTGDPYRIWVSEIILQQTRIEQGRYYYLRFIEHWPTVETLAAASEDEVLREWQGLGYYSRARNMLQAARQITALGHFPDTLDGLRRLKGVGDYTAAAIGSMAFGIDAAVVDGNVYRVLARVFGIDTPINSTEGKKLFAQLAQEQLPKGHAADFNQAMMDFGAIQCTPKSPQCPSCPLAERCDALHTKRTDDLPVKQKKTKVTTRHLLYIYIRCNGQTAIHRRPAGDIWQGLWEPVMLEDNGSTLKELSTLRSHLSPLNCLRRGVRHILTHQRLIADFYLLNTSQRPTLTPDYIWVDEGDLHQYAVPRLVEHLFNAVGQAIK